MRKMETEPSFFSQFICLKAWSTSNVYPISKIWRKRYYFLWRRQISAPWYCYSGCITGKYESQKLSEEIRHRIIKSDIIFLVESTHQILYGYWQSQISKMSAFFTGTHAGSIFLVSGDWLLNCLIWLFETSKGMQQLVLMM